jgi:hypothetical protein
MCIKRAVRAPIARGLYGGLNSFSLCAFASSRLCVKIPAFAPVFCHFGKCSKIIQKKVDTRPAICDIWRTHGNNNTK